MWLRPNPFLNATGKLSSDALNALRSRPDVDSIAEDGIMYIKETITQYAYYLTVHDRISIFTSPTRTDAPWGIARLSQDDTLEDQNATDLAFTYKYDSAAGEGVDIYIVGT